MYFFYEFLGLIIVIFSPIIILFRVISGKEDPKRFIEKFCIYSNKISNKKQSGYMELALVKSQA